MNDEIPKLFKIFSPHSILIQLGLDGDYYGVFFPDFGTYIISSEQRGIDEFTGCPENVKWINYVD